VVPVDKLSVVVPLVHNLGGPILKKYDSEVILVPVGFRDNIILPHFVKIGN
jgi:hypothetical protein